MKYIYFAFALAIYNLLGSQNLLLAADPLRGKYIYNISGCYFCHTSITIKKNHHTKDFSNSAGGRPIRTQYGIFYPPNITPDVTNGIGKWTYSDFRKAILFGVSPNGKSYYPSFPYTSYKGMAEKDVADVWSYMQTLKPSNKLSKNHKLSIPFNFRLTATVWRWLFFEKPKRNIPYIGENILLTRGRYLVKVLGHCGECHTPRNIFGAKISESFLRGSLDHTGSLIPDLKPYNTSSIKSWNIFQLVEYLDSGMLPNGDFAGGKMAEVIEFSTSRMSYQDRLAIATYLKHKL